MLFQLIGVHLPVLKHPDRISSTTVSQPIHLSGTPCPTDCADVPQTLSVALDPNLRPLPQSILQSKFHHHDQARTDQEVDCPTDTTDRH